VVVPDAGPEEDDDEIARVGDDKNGGRVEFDPNDPLPYAEECMERVDLAVDLQNDPVRVDQSCGSSEEETR
jgi:hypothetical protein